MATIGAMVVAVLALAGCPQSGGGQQEAEPGGPDTAGEAGGVKGGPGTAAQAGGGNSAAGQPSAEEVRRLLGAAPFSDLAYHVYLGEGRAALDELGFAPDREERYQSRLEMGELGVFAPRTVDKLGGGTAYIQGDPAQDGCLAFAPDGGPVIWAHASVAWLEQRLPENTDPEYIYYGGGSLGDQFRFYSHESQQQAGEALGGQGLKDWFQLVLDAQAITVRLSERDHDAAVSADRLDFYLGPGRIAELRGE